MIRRPPRFPEFGGAHRSLRSPPDPRMTAPLFRSQHRTGGGRRRECGRREAIGSLRMAAAGVELGVIGAPRSWGAGRSLANAGTLPAV